MGRPLPTTPPPGLWESSELILEVKDETAAMAANDSKPVFSGVPPSPPAPARPLRLCHHPHQRPQLRGNHHPAWDPFQEESGDFAKPFEQQRPLERYFLLEADRPVAPLSWQPGLKSCSWKELVWGVCGCGCGCVRACAHKAALC